MLPQLGMEGTLVDDPVLRFTPSGLAVCNFRFVANDRKRNPDTGQWEQGDALFVTVNCWRQMAENVAETLRKGDRAVVLGQLVQREWEDKDGGKHTSYEIRASNVGADLLFNAAEIKRVQRSEGGGGREEGKKAPAEDKPPW